ncbi:hypothetical protein Anapl_00468 [Anas platyrhynchos]|uniref:Uncharacterized protein n=1 Tax=Anas platyrhynchos TaxID=8839 RepID=R0LHB1_ANAPL|nr:hypothetical protein Anapl_00468 [Anas platyrhynchos]
MGGHPRSRVVSCVAALLLHNGNGDGNGDWGPPGPVQCRHVALAGCCEDVLSIAALRPAMTPLPAHAAFQIAEVKLDPTLALLISSKTNSFEFLPRDLRGCGSCGKARLGGKSHQCMGRITAQVFFCLRGTYEALQTVCNAGAGGFGVPVLPPLQLWGGCGGDAGRALCCSERGELQVLQVGPTLCRTTSPGAECPFCSSKSIFPKSQRPQARGEQGADTASLQGADRGHQEPRERQAAPVQWDNGCVGTEAESKTSTGSLEQGTAEVGASLGLCVLRRASNNLKFSFQSLEESTSPASQLCLWLSEDCCPALLCPPGSKQRVLLWDTPPLLQPPGLCSPAEMLLQPQGSLLAAWLLWCLAEYFSSGRQPPEQCQGFASGKCSEDARNVTVPTSRVPSSPEKSQLGRPQLSGWQPRTQPSFPIAAAPGFALSQCSLAVGVAAQAGLQHSSSFAWLKTKPVRALDDIISGPCKDQSRIGFTGIDCLIYADKNKQSKVVEDAVVFSFIDTDLPSDLNVTRNSSGSRPSLLTKPKKAVTITGVYDVSGLCLVDTGERSLSWVLGEGIGGGTAAEDPQPCVLTRPPLAMHLPALGSPCLWCHQLTPVTSPWAPVQGRSLHSWGPLSTLAPGHPGSSKPWLMVFIDPSMSSARKGLVLLACRCPSDTDERSTSCRPPQTRGGLLSQLSLQQRHLVMPASASLFIGKPRCLLLRGGGAVPELA